MCAYAFYSNKTNECTTGKCLQYLYYILKQNTFHHCLEAYIDEKKNTTKTIKKLNNNKKISFFSSKFISDLLSFKNVTFERATIMDKRAIAILFKTSNFSIVKNKK